MAEEKVETTTEATETEAGAAQQQEATETVTEEETTVDVKAMQEALKKANHEAAANRKKLQAFEEAERKRKEAEMSELEKAQAQIEELQKQTLKAEESARMRAIQAEVIGVSATLEFADPKDALAMIDMTKVETTEEGEIKGVKEQLETLAKSKPYLLKSKQTTNFSATNPSGAKQGETDAERRKRLFG